MYLRIPNANNKRSNVWMILHGTWFLNLNLHSNFPALILRGSVLICVLLQPKCYMVLRSRMLSWWGRAGGKDTVPWLVSFRSYQGLWRRSWKLNLLCLPSQSLLQSGQYLPRLFFADIFVDRIPRWWLEIVSTCSALLNHPFPGPFFGATFCV